jgi:hypothetical protein
MALEAVSKLFARGGDREYATSDVRYGVEIFLQQAVRSEDVHCKVFDGSFRLDVRTRQSAIGQAVLLREQMLREYAKKEFQCSLGDMRVILEW